MNLFQLKKEYLQFLALSDDLDEQAFNDTLESIQAPFEEKIENYFLVVRSIESDVDMIDKEIKRMQDLKKSKQGTIKRLKDAALDALEIVGEETKTGGKRLRFDSPYIKTAYTQKNPPKANITDESKLPEKYFVPQPPKIDSKAIINDWKTNPDEFIEGVEIKQETGVRFK